MARSRSAVAAVAIALSTATSAVAAPLTLDSLLAQFRAVPGLTAHFREEKHLALLAAPLVSEGTIDFAPPARMIRKTTAPVASSLLLDGSQLEVSDGKETQSISLEQNPVVRLFVDSFLKVLVGDEAGLEKIFSVELSARGAGWELRLKPKLAPMNQVLDSIDLQGRGVVLSRMRLLETSGDETVTLFDQVDAARKFTPDELGRVFSLPAAQPQR